MVKIPNRGSARYLARKYNRNETYIRYVLPYWLCCAYMCVCPCVCVWYIVLTGNGLILCMTGLLPGIPFP